MEQLRKNTARIFRRRRVASWMFIAAISLLYLTNLAIRIFVYQDSVWELLRNFLAPLVVAVCICALDRMHHLSTRLFVTGLPKYKVLALCAPVVAALLARLACGHTTDWVDFNIILLASGSMCITVYALSNIQHACIAIVLQSAGFILLAARLNYNTAAMVCIPCIALVLLFCIPKLRWLHPDQKSPWATVVISAVTLIALFFLLLTLEDTQVQEAFWISSLGRPSLGSSDVITEQCALVLTEARFVGAVPVSFPVDSLFSHRVPTYILSQSGWLAVIPVLLALALMISSGVYLCRQSIAIQYYASVTSLAVIVIQTVGYLLTCAGWDALLFSEVCPFLDGGYLINAVFLLMALCILPPKQKTLPDRAP